MPVTCLFSLLCFLTEASAALEIVDIRWGFDGTVVRSQFGMLSVLVDNPSPEAYEGELWLHKQVNTGSPVDAPMVEPVFVGPFARRWVQFYPYIDNNWISFSLSQRDQQRPALPAIDVPRIKLGWPARVIINTTGEDAQGRVPVKGLPDTLFPPFVTATDGLQCVLLDGVPNWDEPRRMAFLNWLARGGVVFVLQTPTGEFPDFPDSLVILRQPLDETTYQAGQVIRVARPRSSLNPTVLTEMFERLPKRLEIQDDGETKEYSPIDVAETTESYPTGNYLDGTDPLAGTSFLSRLRRMTRPNHNWPLLHVLFWIYIALIFPGCWLIGRRWTDYRVTYIALLSTVAIFSVLFGFVGQRGYGEATAVNSVAIIRPLPDDRVDVSQWSNAFVTAGGDYEIRHDGVGATYSTCNISEAVNGRIYCGAEAGLLVDIPPFSSREFAHRIEVPLRTPRITVSEFSANAVGLTSLKLATDMPIPDSAENLVALYNRQFHQLQRVGNGLELGVSLGPPDVYLQTSNLGNWQYQFGGGWGADERPVTDQYRDLFIPLLSRCLNVSTAGDAATMLVPPHVIRVFYVAPLPEELQVQNPYLGKQDGWALYAIDVALPSSP